MRTAEGEMAPLQECFVGTGTTGPKAALRSGAGWPAGGGSGGGVRGGSRSSVEGKSGAKDEEDGRARAGMYVDRRVGGVEGSGLLARVCMCVCTPLCRAVTIHHSPSR
ncbi:hypothetical protein Vafri_22246 [Volvox africanus]|uniref:Uncharacterized protein n=1 Tax=Volvox africanus TaxID=51714 RepID=A0A8J4BUV0_9CHLO|nr:hypothetical protein Vafri_22246 [Volvox africanus]